MTSSTSASLGPGSARLAMGTFAASCLVIASFACSSTSPTLLRGGVYLAAALIGENALPARIDLEPRDDGYRGRLTISLGAPFNVALRSTGIVGDTVTFATSAPVTGMTIRFIGDSLAGSIWLSGNREFGLAGTLDTTETVPDSLATQFALDSWEPDVVSRPGRGEAFPTFSPDGETLYFSTYESDFGSQTIMTSRRRNGRWTPAETGTFSGRYSDRAPRISLDGTRLVFASTRPVGTDTAASTSYNLWELDLREGENRATPSLLSVSSEASDYQPSFTNDGVLYFSSKRPGGLGGQDLYRWDGVGAVENLGPVINSDSDEMSAFIDPLGDYIIFSTSTARGGHIGNDDLYISFRRGAEWTTAANLGVPINSFANEYGPTVSADGQYLYFASDRHPPANIYRVAIAEVLTEGPR